MSKPDMLYVDRVEECDACREQKKGLVVVGIPTKEDLDIYLCRECIIELGAVWMHRGGMVVEKETLR